MAILGLATTESDANWRFKNVRRQVFYFYPNGAAPLTGLLSLLSDEDTDDPEFIWYEKRLDQQRTTTGSIGGIGPWAVNPGAEGTDAAATTGGNQTFTQGSLHALVVLSTAMFRCGHVVRVRDQARAAGANVDVFGVITLVDHTDLKINIRSINAITSTVTQTTNVNAGKEVLIVGSSFTQGSSATTGGLVAAGAVTLSNNSVYNVPSSFTNYAQIFRTPFELTGSALKTGLKYDDTGPYKDVAKEASVYHMIEMEKAFLFGQQAKETTSSNSLPRFLSGGVLDFLTKWEAGSYGTVTATLDTDDDKRIITNAAGTINEKTYNAYLERVFRVTNNTANEKLVLCGSGFLSVINQLYKDKTSLNSDLPMGDTYGMNVTKHVCPFGTLYYKSHPLFSQNPLLRFNAMILDVQNIKYRYMQGRDTMLLKNRQNPGDDFRRDEWLSECGIELRFPESCMYLQNVQNYTP